MLGTNGLHSGSNESVGDVPSVATFRLFAVTGKLSVSP